MNTNQTKPTGLARVREAAGLTQDELAAKIGVSPSTVQRWEGGYPILEKYRDALEQLFPNTDDIKFKPDPVYTATAKSNSAFAKARVRAGLSQLQLAEMLNVTLTTVKRWENEYLPIDIRQYAQLEKVLGDVSGFKFSEPKVGLALARLNAGLTRQQLAKALGARIFSVGEWENHRCPVPFKYRDKLEQIIGDISGITFTGPPENSPLAQARIEAGLTQRQLGAALGVSYMTVRNWEHGSALPKPKYREKLEEVLGIKIEDVLKDELNTTARYDNEQ